MGGNSNNHSGDNNYSSKILQSVRTASHPNSIMCEDHLGNRYSSLAEMCRQYDIAIMTYRERIKRGMSVKQALTTPVRLDKIVCQDHLGNTYPSLSEMCSYYGVSYQTYRYRMERGVSLEKALTGKDIEPKKVKDHLGNEFVSVSAMCRYYGISQALYSCRLKRGMSLKDILTKPTLSGTKSSGLKVTEDKIDTPCLSDISTTLSTSKMIDTSDILGTINDTKHSDCMPCSEGITQLKSQCNLRRYQEPLIFSVASLLEFTAEEEVYFRRRTGEIVYTDHLGNEYPSLMALQKQWGIPPSVYKSRLYKGWTLGETLTGLVFLDYRKDGYFVDQYNNRFRTVRELATYYGIAHDVVAYRLRQGYPIEQAVIKYETVCKANNEWVGLNDKIFNSIKEMSIFYKKNYTLLRKRICYGWSLEEILLLFDGEGGVCKDFNGKTFVSLIEMCNHWDIMPMEYIRRMRKGFTQMSALTLKIPEKSKSDLSL